MASHANVVVHRGVLFAGAIALLGLGAAGTYVLGLQRGIPSGPRPQMTSTGSSATAVGTPMNGASEAVTITLTKEAVQRAGIERTPVTMAREAEVLRIPGVVQPDAYKTVSVTPLTSGRLTRAAVELGQSVRRGQVLAEIYSPELVDARTQYLSARAALEAHELELRRTETLVEIGAASRRELEMIHAEHTAATAAVDSDRAKLSLFGLSDQDIDTLIPGSERAAIFRVVAPADGIVTARDANVGLNVEPSMSLFTVADLSDVWVVGDLYERDCRRWRSGGRDVCRVPAPADSWKGVIYRPAGKSGDAYRASPCRRAQREGAASLGDACPDPSEYRGPE
jgi:multidrug efflux pump subunit AcrA (membrane-fusion protein)